MKVAVIGAGPAGLSAIRWLKLEPKITEIIGFEATGGVGGVWNYTDNTEIDEFGTPITCSLYQNLRTNVAKQTMEFFGYPRGNSAPTFTDWKTVLEYIEYFAEKEDLKKFIKFHHQVINVVRENDTWVLTAKNMVNKQEKTETFDSVMVCNGFTSKPNYSTVSGIDDFKGIVTHSRYYRKPVTYADKKVLIIGGGPSAEDIAIDLIGYAQKVIMSHHSTYLPLDTYPPSLIMKPDTKETGKHSAIFTDDSEEEIDVIIFCTGYVCDFPFIDRSCGLNIEDFKVYPLYKHVVNANQPTMFILGIVKQVSLFTAVDLQARYCVKSLSAGFLLPSHELMLQDIETDRLKLIKLNNNRKDFYHTLRKVELEYYSKLSTEAKISYVRPVIVELIDAGLAYKFTDVSKYRSHIYRIIDDCTFARRFPEDEEEEIIVAGSTHTCGFHSC